MTNKKDTSIHFSDAYVNTMKGIGGAGDPRLYGHNMFTKNLEMNWVELGSMYREFWAAQQFVDGIPEDMTREWRVITDNELDSEQIDEYAEIEQYLNLPRLFKEAQIQANLYGNSWIVMDIEGTGEPDEPLIIDNIKPDAQINLYVVDRSSVAGETPTFTTYTYMPEFTHYIVVGTNTRVHRSRMLPFYGKKLSGYLKRINGYYDASVLSPVYELLTNLSAAEAVLHTYITEGDINVWKIDNLANNLTDATSASETSKYIAEAKAMASIVNAMVIDEKDDVSVLSKDTKNVVDVYKQLLDSVVAASSQPATVFLGTSPQGFNATGESDEKNYYIKVRCHQMDSFNPCLQILDQVLCKLLGYDIEHLDFEWCSLYLPDPKDVADTNKVFTDTVLEILQAGLIQEQHALQELINNDVLKSLPEEWITELEQTVKRVNSENDTDELDSDGE